MAKPKFECVVSADLFRRAAFAVSTDDVRFYITGVHISPAPEGGAILCATNGHFLIAMHDPAAFIDGEAIIKLTAPMKAALKASGTLLESRLLIVRANDAGERAFIVDVAQKGAADDYSPYLAARELHDAPDARVKSAQFGAVIIDGTFPDWRRILPASLNHDGAFPPINQRLLSLVAEALSATAEKSRTVRMTASADTNGPVLVMSTQTFAPAGFAIVMPIRDEGRRSAVPAWAMRQEAKAA